MELQQASIRQTGASHIPSQILNWVQEQGVNLSCSKFSTPISIDKNIYAGTLIDQDKHIMKYLIDLEHPEDCTLNDVTIKRASKPKLDQIT